MSHCEYPFSCLGCGEPCRAKAIDQASAALPRPADSHAAGGVRSPAPAPFDNVTRLTDHISVGGCMGPPDLPNSAPGSAYVIQGPFCGSAEVRARKLFGRNGP